MRFLPQGCLHAVVMENKWLPAVQNTTLYVYEFSPNDFELLDTPGVLWPKLEETYIGENLAVTGAIRDEIIDTWELAEALVAKLTGRYSARLNERYNIAVEDGASPREVLELIAAKRGYRVRGGEADYERTAAVLVDDFRSGKLGRISLEVPEK